MDHQAIPKHNKLKAYEATIHNILKHSQLNVRFNPQRPSRFAVIEERNQLPDNTDIDVLLSIIQQQPALHKLQWELDWIYVDPPIWVIIGKESSTHDLHDLESTHCSRFVAMHVTRRATLHLTYNTYLDHTHTSVLNVNLSDPNYATKIANVLQRRFLQRTPDPPK